MSGPWGQLGASGLTLPTKGARMRFRILFGAAMMVARCCSYRIGGHHRYR